MDPDNGWCLCAECHHTVDTHEIERGLLIGETIRRARFQQLIEAARAAEG